MINQIKEFKENAIALELLDNFTETDALFIEQLFQKKLNQGYKELKGFFESELWGFKHFGKIGRCAVVSHSKFMKSIVNVENNILRLFNSALEEKYFDETELDDALKFITPQTGG